MTISLVQYPLNHNHTLVNDNTDIFASLCAPASQSPLSAYLYSTQYSHILEQAHSTYDPEKVEVGGSIAISQDGIATNFLVGNNYIRTNKKIDTTNAQSLRIEYEFCIKKESTSGQLFLFNYGRESVNGNPCLQIYQGKIQGSLGKLFETPAETGRTYKVIGHYSEDKKAVEELYIDGVLAATKSGTLSKTWKQDNYMYLGRNYSSPTDAEVNLKALIISVDGKDVYNCNKTGTDEIKPDNFTVTGSPTISADGILTTSTGYNDTNKINSINLNLSDNNFYFEDDFILTENPAVNSYFYWFSAVGETNTFLRFVQNASGLGVQLYKQNTSLYSGTFSGINLNTWYRAVVRHKDNWTFEIYDKASGVLVSSLTSDAAYNLTANTNFDLSLPVALQAFRGQMDLKALKIESNGKILYSPYVKIPYIQSKSGAKIVDGYYLEFVKYCYNQTGQALYIVLDSENNLFYLPMGDIAGFITQNKTDTAKNTADILTNINSIKEIQKAITSGASGSVIEFPNGCIIQWGYKTNLSTTVQRINFYKPYKVGYQVVSNDTGNGFAAMSTAYIDLAGFGLSGNLPDISAVWIAIGY